MFGIGLARRIRRAYLNTFAHGAPDAQIVLLDLARLCHYRQTVHAFDDQGRIDPIGSAQLEGRRQVYLHVLQQINLTDEELEAMQATVGGEEYD